MDFEECKHNYGTSICFESGYERCNACGVAMNVSKQEFYSNE